MSLPSPTRPITFFSEIRRAAIPVPPIPRSRAFPSPHHDVHEQRRRSRQRRDCPSHPSARSDRRTQPARRRASPIPGTRSPSPPLGSDSPYTRKPGSPQTGGHAVPPVSPMNALGLPVDVSTPAPRVTDPLLPEFSPVSVNDARNVGLDDRFANTGEGDGASGATIPTSDSENGTVRPGWRRGTAWRARAAGPPCGRRFRSRPGTPRGGNDERDREPRAAK